VKIDLKHRTAIRVMVLSVLWMVWYSIILVFRNMSPQISCVLQSKC